MDCNTVANLSYYHIRRLGGVVTSNPIHDIITQTGLVEYFDILLWCQLTRRLGASIIGQVHKLKFATGIFMPDEMDVPNNSTIELIKRLSVAVGVGGYNGPNSVYEAILAELSPYVDRVERDRMGSVVGVKTGQQAAAPDAGRRKIMLAAHLDFNRRYELDKRSRFTYLPNGQIFPAGC